MEERNVKVENIYKYFDMEIRKSMILSAFVKCANGSNRTFAE